MEGTRRARPDDLRAVADLARAMREELGPMKGGALLLARETKPEPLEETYGAMLERDDALLVVGCIDEVVVGFGAVEVESLRTGEHLGIVTDLFVDGEARSIGIGEAMAGAIVEFCRERQCVGVDARALPGHRATKNFFEEQGFTARAIVMHKPLRPDA